ncbi:hypothetical protein Tco_0989469 [Tanacetum coccineum]|uniref:Reverse transcriptase Ty1/copia-type domain-containing protein n=1 Tax=Tanacetum coccineum TaxID=301880 RepID=A0ABQ5ETV3_9ASTR
MILFSIPLDKFWQVLMERVDEGKQGVSESSTSSQQDQDCIVMPIWKDASYFGDDAPRSVADAQIQDKDRLQDENDATEKSHEDSSLKDNGSVNQQVNTAIPEVNTGSRDISTVVPEVNTAIPKDLVGPSHASEVTQVEDQEIELGNIPQSYAVQQKKKGIFISQDKYVHEILRKYNYTDVKSASTPTDLEKPLVQDGDAADVDEHLYRSMIGSLMYLTASRPDIMFAVCACARFQYSKDSPLELVAYTNSDYARATQDRKSTTRGCQFLGNRLITWQCKKQTVVATSTTKAEYVTAANCCGQSDPEEDPEEDDEDPEEDPADYPADRDDDDEEEEEPSGDDADDEDEDEDEDEEEEEEEHPAPADSVPPVHRMTARISIRDEPSISLPPREEVERLLALTTPPPSPLTPLSSPLPQIPSPPLLPIPAPISSPPVLLPPTDRRADRPEVCLPPRKRLCSTQGPRYEVGESSSAAAARPTRGRRADYGFVGTMDTEIRRQRAEEVGYGIRDVWVDPREAVEEVAPMTLEGVNTRVTELAAVQEQDTQDIYAVIEDTQDRQTQIYQRVETLVDDSQYHYETARLLDQERSGLPRGIYGDGLEAADRRSQTVTSEMLQVDHMRQAEIAALRTFDRTQQEQLVQTLTLMQSLQGHVTTL